MVSLNGYGMNCIVPSQQLGVVSFYFHPVYECAQFFNSYFLVDLSFHRTKPEYLFRVWCIFELFTASQYDGCEVTIEMPSRERKNFIDGVANMTEWVFPSIDKLIIILPFFFAFSTNFFISVSSCPHFSKYLNIGIGMSATSTNFLKYFVQQM